MGPDLQEWRRARPRPVPGERPSTVGSRWELWVNAGGRLAELEPPALAVGAVAALGQAAGGVGFITFGLHLALPAPEGCKPGETFWPDRETFGPLRRVHDELLGHLGFPENSGLEGMYGRGPPRS